MTLANIVDRLGPRITTAAFTVVLLTIMDAFLTLELVTRGASELNPVMDFYLTKGPTLFIVVKYLLISASLFLILAAKDTRCFGGKVPAASLILIHILILGLVVHKQICMKLSIL